ncbi:hypothetical protein K1719_002593 [Acacia pycnantha]|nr:hypothetical protein K1719_002593 [Acacia pycnantha]
MAAGAKKGVFYGTSRRIFSVLCVDEAVRTTISKNICWTSHYSQRAYIHEPVPQKVASPDLAYFHIPLAEYASFDSSNFTGVKQEGIGSASVNSGFFTKHIYECIQYLVFIPDQISVLWSN